MEDTYDKIYKEADSLLKQYNPCQIKDGYCANKYNLEHGLKDIQFELCCGGCKYHSITGCTTKALACKVGLCSQMRQKYPELTKKLDALYTRGVSAGIPMYNIRMSKEEMLSKKPYPFV